MRQINPAALPTPEEPEPAAASAQSLRALDPDAVIARLEPLLLPRRAERMRQVLARRTAQVAFVFEDMVDPHNMSAALRSVEAFGFQDVHLVNPAARIGFARKITQGTERWLTVQNHESLPECIEALKAAGFRVLASHLEASAGEDPAAGPGPEPLTALDLSRPIALVFGNEHAGVTELALRLADGTFRIDMLGFVESLNLSVACAISAFHARERLDRLAAVAGDPARFALPEARQQALYAQWLRQSVKAAEKLLAQAT
jgi:tRNA (guanosine-2'-O-)-methyltransferase